jgi:hypothetical protein
MAEFACDTRLCPNFASGVCIAQLQKCDHPPAMALVCARLVADGAGKSQHLC